MNPASEPISKPSSNAYAVELAPSPQLRLVVLAGGWLALLAGLAIILHLDTSLWRRAALAAIWAADVARELDRQARGQRRVVRLMLDRGRHGLAIGRSGLRRPVRLLAASMLTRRLAWLRLRFDDGRVYGELLSPAAVGAASWRRLHVLWRWGLQPND